MLRPSTYMDDIGLHALGKFWGTRISIVWSTGLSEHRLRHECALEEAELTLGYNMKNHYFGIGENASSHTRFYTYCTILHLVHDSPIYARFYTYYTILQFLHDSTCCTIIDIYMPLFSEFGHQRSFYGLPHRLRITWL